MKRAIVLQVRESENKQNNNEKTVWVTVGLLPSKMKNGNLYYPRTTDVCVSTCAGARGFRLNILSRSHRLIGKRKLIWQREKDIPTLNVRRIIRVWVIVPLTKVKE